MFRFETFYAFNETFVSPQNTFEKSDELRIGLLGIDWKIKIPVLEPQGYFHHFPPDHLPEVDRSAGRRGTVYGYRIKPSEAEQLVRRRSISVPPISMPNWLPSFYLVEDFTQKSDFSGSRPPMIGVPIGWPRWDWYSSMGRGRTTVSSSSITRTTFSLSSRISGVKAVNDVDSMVYKFLLEPRMGKRVFTNQEWS